MILTSNRFEPAADAQTSPTAGAMRIPFLLSILFTLLTLDARATTVVPPSFPELVGQAEAIYRGQVKNVESRRVARADGGTVIKTFVTFAIERTLKGQAQ